MAKPAPPTALVMRCGGAGETEEGYEGAMISVFIVADDFGMSSAVNRATGLLLSEGTASIPSLLVAAPATDEAVRLLHTLDQPHVGLHLNLTEPAWPAVCGTPSALTDQSACFLGLEHAVRVLEQAPAELMSWLVEELTAQRDRLLSFGLSLTHIAGHHHIHVMPAVREALAMVFSAERPFVRGYEFLPTSPQKREKVRPHLLTYGVQSTLWFRERGFPLTSMMGFQWSDRPSRDTFFSDLESSASTARYREWMIHAAEYLPGEPTLSLAREQEYQAVRGLLAAEGTGKVEIHVVSPDEVGAVHEGELGIGTVPTAERIRVLLGAPVLPPSSRGNAVTVQRLLRQLRSERLAVTCVTSDELAERVTANPARWDLLHGFHLVRTYAGLDAAAERMPLPYVLTQTGTDLGAEVVREPRFLTFLSGASAIVFPHAAAMREFQRRYPEVDPSLCLIIPKSLEPFPRAEPLPAEFLRRVTGRTILLLPAHLRPVKGIETALAGFRELRDELPATEREHFCLVIAGRVLDEAYVQALDLPNQPGVIHVECTRSQMSELYSRSAIVLNTSLVEGSPNAVLEALHCGCVVVGRGIPGILGIAELAEPVLGPRPSQLRGSSWPLQIFESPGEYPSLCAALSELLRDPAALTPLRQNALRAYAYLGDQHREVAAYLAMYRSVRRERWKQDNVPKPAA